MENISSVLEIGNLASNLIGHPMGCYITNPEKKMEELNKDAQYLFAFRHDVEVMITREPNVATSESKLWLEDVKQAELVLKSIQEDHMQCTNAYSRMKLGKRVGDAIEKISNLNNKRPKLKGKDFSNAPLERVEPQPVEANSSTDSEPRLQEILGLIEDVGIRKIGIWGMGGIGKTRTLRLLNNLLVESHMFDIVIWVTVSGEGSRRKVQNDIAERLKCTGIDMSDDRLRANIFHHLSGKKFLLILDDIWERIDLFDVGIPILNQDNGCKVLLTTRDLGVCRQMETDVEIQMKKLSEEEAWSLFNEKAGDVAMSPCIEPIARDIVKKCSGLPLAIIVIGSSLRKNGYVAVWRSTLRRLQSPSTSQIKGMEKEVFSCLRISYDQLPNDFERNLFLYCSLYPEDHNILITELVEYCWLEGYIQGVDSIEEARDDGRHMVVNLVDASLLETGYNEKYIKMHDIIRDFALKEASGFLVKTGKHVKHLPEENKWLQSKKISLMKCSLGCLSERPNCGSLSTLLLQDNDQLTMIPYPFFECMHSLCILDLSMTKIKSLPSSLCNLVNLRGLYLKYCRKLKQLPSQVGALKQLEVLDLGGSTAIRYLPKEVGELTRLKRLIVRFQYRIWSRNDDKNPCSEDNDDEDACSEDDDDEDACSKDDDDDDKDACSQDNDDDDACSEDNDDKDACSQHDDDKDTKEWKMKLRVPTGIIPKLLYLEELSLYVSLNYQCVEKEQWDDESMEVVVEELCRLEHLTYLDAYFPKVECLEHFLRHSKSVKATSWFRRFRFRVGTEITESPSWLPSRFAWGERHLVYKGGFGMSHAAAVTETLAHSSTFLLQEHRTARKLSGLVQAKMKELKGCHVIHCEKMETLFDGDEEQEACALLPNLEFLWLKNLPELRSLCDGPLLPGSLSNLLWLRLHSCKNLKKVFQLGIIRQLCSLETLEVDDCSKMEEIIEIEEEEEMSVASHSHNITSYNNDRVILPNIKEVFLTYLPELVSICRGFSNFEWPSLESIQIHNCPKVKSLSFLSNGTDIVAPAGSLSKLRRLQISDCENLKKVLQLGIIRQLCSLEELSVSSCWKMEEIIEIEEEEEMSVASHSHNVTSYNNDRVILPNIKYIHLSSLPELVSICRGFSNFEWPSLETIFIHTCPKLKSLSFLSNGTNIAAPALKKISGLSSWWEALEWEDNDIKQRLQPFFMVDDDQDRNKHTDDTVIN